MWSFLRRSSSDRVGCEDKISIEYTKLEAKFAEREHEMQRELGKYDGNKKLCNRCQSCRTPPDCQLIVSKLVSQTTSSNEGKV